MIVGGLDDCLDRRIGIHGAAIGRDLVRFIQLLLDKPQRDGRERGDLLAKFLCLFPQFFGWEHLGHDAILAGEMYGSVCTRPKLLGTLMFKAMYEAVTNPDTPKARFISYDMPQITKAKIEDCPEQW